MTGINITNTNILEVKLKPFMFYLHNWDSKGTSTVVSEPHQNKVLSPVPATPVAIFSSVRGGEGASLGAL